jgi:ribosomal protein S18 acetylase RimI-like enzyme
MIADNFDFRFANTSDASAVASLIERAYRGSEAAKGWTNESAILTGPRSSVREIERLVRDADSRFVLAIANGEVAGCALIQKYGEGAYFGMFAIDPGLQQAGLGKMLVARCEVDAKKLWQARYLRLTVISLRDELIAWYERRGFVVTGEHEPFPFRPAAGAVRTDFDLVVLQKPL